MASPGVDVKALRVLKIDDQVLASFVTFTIEIIPDSTNLFSSLKVVCSRVSATDFLMPPGIFPKTLSGDGVASSEANLSVGKYTKRPTARVPAMSGPFAALWSFLRTLGKC